MSEDRSWMYTGRRKRDSFTNECFQKAKAFIEHAFRVVPNADIDGVRCPCSSCLNCKLQNKEVMQFHLGKYGFKANYEVWTAHGETLAPQQQPTPLVEDNNQMDRMDEMMFDVCNAHEAIGEEEPEPTAQAFYEMLSASEQPIHDRTRITQLDAVARLMNVKSQYNLSISCFDDFLKVVCELLPSEHRLPPNLYECKKLLGAIGLPHEKIDVCTNNCMLFRKEHEKKDRCDICGESRYFENGDESEERKRPRVARKILRYLPITQRLQRMFMSEESSKHTQWHKKGVRYKPGYMVHPSDGEAWKQFDKDFPDFASEPRNIRFGLATDGFMPFIQAAAPYTCWPVFVLPYNLSPGLCMREHNIFLSLVIPGPEYPGKKLDVFLQPLIDELIELWENGAVTYDRATRQNFRMRVAFLWPCHDYPAYGIFAGWCVHGKFSRPVCMEQLKATWLEHGRKYSWFDCHRRFLPIRHRFRRNKSAFRSNITVSDLPPHRFSGEEVRGRLASLFSLAGPFDGFEGYREEHNWTHISCLWKLPYFSKLVLRHNIDVMHNEKNVAEAIFNTCFDIPDRTKDNVKARLDQEEICNRRALNIVKTSTGNWKKPRAAFCLTREQRIKFPDGYAANLRRGVNIDTIKINGLKSHDYHIFIERLLPVAFHGYLPDDIWQVLPELSLFYRQLCAKELDPLVISNLEANIPVLLCKLEKIFPPRFFNPMQHLMIHLPYEARVGSSSISDVPI